MRTPRLALASVAAGGALVMGTVLALPAAAATPTFKDCAEAARAGYTNIPASSPYYQSYLDRNHNGVACESNGSDVVVAAAAGLRLGPGLPCQEHPGYTCTAHNEDAVGLHVGVAVNDLAALRARVNLKTPCADVAGLLVQAQLGVRTTHKAVVSDQQAVNKARQDVRDAQKADDVAAAKLATAQAADNTAIANLAAAQTAANTAHAQLAAIQAEPITTLNHAARLAAAQLAASNADAALASARTAKTSADAALAMAQRDKANADTTLANAKAAERAAEAQYAADRSAETVAAGLVVTLRTNLINCRIPVPTPAPTTEPAPVVVAPQPSEVFITPAQPPVIVNNPQVGVIPQGPAPTGAMDSADRYLG